MGVHRIWKDGRIASALALCAGLFAAPAQAAVVQGTGKATIVRPGSLIEIDQLRFGSIIPSATAGTVTITILGARSTTGGVTAYGGTFGAARFAGVDVQGPFTANVHAPTPSTVVVTRVGGGPTMTVTNMIVENGAGTYTTPANVPFQVRVGGRLNVGANQAPGTYTGTFSLTVDYQ